MNNEQLTEESFAAYLAALEADLAGLTPGQPKRAVLYEIGGEKPFIDAPRRKALAGILARHRAVLGEVTAGYAMVSHSTVARGVLTAIFWIEKPPYQTRVFGTLQEGVAWLTSICPRLDGAVLLSEHAAAHQMAKVRFGT